MTQEMLEILIGKYLDGEITPSEQHILQAELDRDAEARELLRNLQDLHACSSELVACEIIGRGRTPEDILEQAWQQQAKQPFHSMVRMGGYIRFAAGLAAGLLMGLAVHFILPVVSAPRNDPVAPDAFVQNTPNGMDVVTPILPQPPGDPAGDSARNVDWYNFTDNQGNQWLIEGFRENIARPAAYYGDL